MEHIIRNVIEKKRMKSDFKIPIRIHRVEHNFEYVWKNHNKLLSASCIKVLKLYKAKNLQKFTAMQTHRR